MKPKQKLMDQFNTFAGREVNVVEATRTRRTHVAEDDPAVSALRRAADAAGLSVRVWLPDSGGTCDMRNDRLNVNVEKEADGKYRIQKDFRIG